MLGLSNVDVLTKDSCYIQNDKNLSPTKKVGLVLRVGLLSGLLEE